MDDQESQPPPAQESRPAHDASNAESPARADRDMQTELPGNVDRLTHFIQMLSDDNDGTRWKAAEALGRAGDPAALEALINTLWDDDSRVRLKAAWALGRIGEPRALCPLQRLYRIENEGAQEIISEAIEEIRLRMNTA